MEWLLFSWPTLILLGIGLRMSLRLNYGARGPEPGDPVYMLLNITGWVLIALGLTPAVLIGVASLVGIIIVMVGGMTVIEMVMQGRTAQRRSMCRMLALLVERGAQLEPSILLAGQTMRGMVGRAARKLFDAISHGMPLGAAIKRFPGALPREAPAYLAAGASRGARLAAFRELSGTLAADDAGYSLRRSEVSFVATWRDCIDRLSYLAAVLVIMGVVIAFLMIKIVPQYRQIFDEFQISLPPMTELSVTLSDFIVNYMTVPLILFFLLFFVTMSVLSICYLCDIHVLQGITDRLFRGRQTGDVLRILAIAMEHDQSLNEVMNRLAVVYPSAPLRRQIQRAAVAAAAGTDWRDAMKSAAIISDAERAMLHSAEQTRNLPWALREIAVLREKRLIFRLAAMLQVIYPFTILMLGVFVAFYMFSLFIPIIQLIRGLTQ